MRAFLSLICQSIRRLRRFPLCRYSQAKPQTLPPEMEQNSFRSCCSIPPRLAHPNESRPPDIPTHCALIHLPEISIPPNFTSAPMASSIGRMAYIITVPHHIWWNNVPPEILPGNL